MIESIKLPVKIINGEVWFSFRGILSKAKMRAIGIS